MSAWAQLEQLLTCAICLDRFRNPKLLPCQHTFCGEPCMDGLIDYARRQIKCPECRAEHRIPYNGVQSFPNNVTLSRFLDLHRSITGEEPDPLPSQMDRCGVCGEKSFCLRCAHCDKKVCEECRTAHLDILRREINRLNTQVRRGLSKLAENACQFNKSGDKLVQLSTQIQDEITEGVRRLIRDLKDKESKLLAELEEFSVSESKNSEKLKEDLEQELDTITSNCELVEAHITETDEWTDAELMEYKEIFLKTLDFLRNLDPDTMDFARKIKYIPKVDLENVRRTVADFGEIKITPASCSMNAFGISGMLSPSESTANLSLPQGSLSRSQSDHRLVAQLAKSGSRSDLQRSYLDVTGGNRYGSDSDRERGSSPPGKRGERFGSVRSYDDRGRYAAASGRSENSEFNYTRGWQRPGDTDYEPSNSSNFRSRFMRERIRERGGGDDHSFEEHEDTSTAAPRVRFQEEESQAKKTKLFDTEEMTSLRAPLSGLIKLVDSPHVMERLHQNEAKAKLKAIEAANEATAAAIAPTPATNFVAPRPTRQISEDEIEKQKKQAQAQAAAQSNNNNTATPTAPKPTTAATTTTTVTATNEQQTQQASNRRVQTLQKEDTRSVRSSSEETSIASDDTGGDFDGTTQQQSSPPVSTRRRMFASTRTNTSGSNSNSNGQKPSYGNDYNDSNNNTTSTATTRTSSSNNTGGSSATTGNTPGNRQVSATTNNHTKNKTQKHTQTNKNSVSANIQVSVTSPSKVMASGTAALTTTSAVSNSASSTTTTTNTIPSSNTTNKSSSVGNNNNNSTTTTTPSVSSSKSSSNSSFTSAINDNNNNPQQQESIQALIQAYATPKNANSGGATYQTSKNKYLTTNATGGGVGGSGSASVDLSDIYLSDHHHPSLNSYTSSTHHYPSLTTPTTGSSSSSSFDAQLYRLTSPPPSLPSSSSTFSPYSSKITSNTTGSGRHQYGPVSSMSSSYIGNNSSNANTSSSMLSLMSPGVGGVNNTWQPPVMPPSSAAILGMVENGLVGVGGGGGSGGTGNSNSSGTTITTTSSPNQSTDHFYRAFHNCLTLPCLNPLATTVEPNDDHTTSREDEAKHAHIGSKHLEDIDITERTELTRKRIIRLNKDKDKMITGSGNEQTTTTATLDMSTPREFRGQEKPNYNPYRQSQTSLASNSSKYLPTSNYFGANSYGRVRDTNTGLLASSNSTDAVTTTSNAARSHIGSLYGTTAKGATSQLSEGRNNNSTASTTSTTLRITSSVGFPNSSNARVMLRLYF